MVVVSEREPSERRLPIGERVEKFAPEELPFLLDSFRDRGSEVATCVFAEGVACERSLDLFASASEKGAYYLETCSPDPIWIKFLGARLDAVFVSARLLDKPEELLGCLDVEAILELRQELDRKGSHLSRLKSDPLAFFVVWPPNRRRGTCKSRAQPVRYEPKPWAMPLRDRFPSSAAARRESSNVESGHCRRHHRIVWDDDVVREFDELLNSDLGGDRVRVATLLARSKYLSPEERFEVDSPSLKNMHLTRRLVRRGEPLLQTARAYETPVETYLCQGRDGRPKPIPAGCLALYVTVRPRSCWKAYAQLSAKVQQMVADSLIESSDETRSSREAGQNALEFVTRLESEFKGAVHRAVCFRSRHLLDLDVDTKDPEKLAELGNLFRELGVADKMFCAVETRGGFHVVFDKERVQSALGRLHVFAQATRFSAHNALGKGVVKHWLSVSGDGMIPVPGTFQGGFPVRLLPKSFRFA